MAKRERQSIRRESPREFFIQIPSFLEYLPDLDPFAWRLYIHYLRVCGEDDSCYEYTATTSTLCNMSERTIRYRRQLLADLNLISFWHEGRRGNERVNVIIRDIWGINAMFLRLVQRKSTGDWVESWIRSELSKMEPFTEESLSESKKTPASDAGPPASDAKPPASDADKERSLIKIPYKDTECESLERDRAATQAELPPTHALADAYAKSESFDGPLDPTPKAKTAGRVASKPAPASPRFDGRKFVMGLIPADTGTTPVEVYYESFSIQTDATRLTALDEDDLTKACPDLDRLRAVCVEYRRSSYRKGDLQLILDWYRDPSRLPSNRHRTHTNGSKPATVTPITEITLKDWLLRTYYADHLPNVMRSTNKTETEIRNEYKQWRVAHGLPPG